LTEVVQIVMVLIAVMFIVTRLMWTWTSSLSTKTRSVTQLWRGRPDEKSKLNSKNG